MVEVVVEFEDVLGVVFSVKEQFGVGEFGQVAEDSQVLYNYDWYFVVSGEDEHRKRDVHGGEDVGVFVEEGFVFGLE